MGRKNVADSARPPKPCASAKWVRKPHPQSTARRPRRPWMTPRGYDRFSTPHASHESRLISPLSYNSTALGGRMDFLLPRPNERCRRHESKAQGATRCCCALLSMSVTARRPLRTRGGQWHARHVSSASQNPMTTWSLKKSQVRQMCGAKQRILGGTYAPVRRNFPTTLLYIGHL